MVFTNVVRRASRGSTLLVSRPESDADVLVD